ncbi:hypothetical protein KP509_08G032100 [Ceratopteris richardii]|uniref:ADP-ribosyl cyclase/cyclic ADP-ribose hydrolase n=1 Tax=Ceratopteris richardii TaxID=49495 RepID=A0A8T2UFB2_CERRI|nr:hypothetical protein KP509_08G032100 [Ceratopteris richardii]
MPISRECLPYDVFICHWQVDTQLNAVTVLRGIFLSKGIIPFVVGYGKNDGVSELNPDIVKAIQNSKVYVIFLSQNFATSKRCLEEVAYIMHIRGTSDASRTPTFLPVFYDVKPSTVRYQKANYDLNKVEGSTQEQRNGWATALHELSKLHGLEYKTASMYLWETLYEIVKEVEAIVKEVVPFSDGPRWANKIKEVFDALELKEKSEEIFLVGVYGRNKSEFANLLVKASNKMFNRVY